MKTSSGGFDDADGRHLDHYCATKFLVGAVCRAAVNLPCMDAVIVFAIVGSAFVAAVALILAGALVAGIGSRNR